MASQVPERDRAQRTEPVSPGSATPDPSGSDRRQEPIAVPRWVKVFGVVAAIVVVLVVVILLGGHGPGRHHG